MTAPLVARARAAWRYARSLPGLRAVVEAVDRIWWARVILRADVVDLDIVAAQGGPATPRAAVRAYVRGGFRSGMTLNPLFMERLVSSQLSDAGRVPALYAYLVNDARTIRAGANWDAPAYAALHPDSVDAPGGPLGHAWRAARRDGSIVLGSGPTRRVAWDVVRERAARAAGHVARGSTVPSRFAGDVVVCRLSSREEDAAAAIDATVSVAADLGAPDILVAVAGSSADLWTNAALLELWLPGTRVVADAPGLLETVAERSGGAGTLVVRGPDADIEADDLRELAARGVTGPVMPLWLSTDGTVVAAGVCRHEGRAFALLEGHPSEDARALGTTIETAGIAGDTFARPLGANAEAAARTALDLTVRAPRRGLPRSAGVQEEDTDLDALLRPVGLEVASWGREGPVLRRRRYDVTLDDGSVVPSLRWAIKIAAPPGRPGEAWGDTHFARGIADALRRLGQEVVIDAYSARLRPSGYLDDVVLALRGPEPIHAQPGARSLIWIISHPDEITAAELSGFDVVFAGSRPWAAEASVRFGRPIQTLLQCTDARRFRPTGAGRTDDIVFVGTARGIPRPSIIEPIRAGIPVRVYGPDWRGWIPASAIAGRGVPNRDLPLVYERADLVLNDHWPAMKAAGFVSNRLFDVVAAGGRAVSDAVAGIDEIFEGAVRTYDDVPALLGLLRGDRDRLFPDAERLADISARVRRDHSFDARARTLLDAALSA
ncbi:glycosyltransferase [Microbacterium sp. BK668]|uniref:glycosyltransferase n=1 Tax=Microbacterium sp. BK668 TaxID=2512118 RepID=UPI00106129D4|nr:glycosyltransferase [Microbacterium sp. BK668]TDN88380.1 hypothetical protein EV279_2822 [Microbacterium sp. BK668]